MRRQYLDLFDKRFKVYSELGLCLKDLQWLAGVSNSQWDGSNERIRIKDIRLEESKFLFDSEVWEFVEQVRLLASKMSDERPTLDEVLTLANARDGVFSTYLRIPS